MPAVEIDIFKIILESGLVVKSVFIILVLCSVISWSIILKKKRLLSQLRDNDSEFLDVFTKSKSLKEIMYKAELMDFSPSHRQLQPKMFSKTKFVLKVL